MKYKVLFNIRTEVTVTVDADSELKAIHKARALTGRLVSGVIKERKLRGIEEVK